MCDPVVAGSAALGAVSSGMQAQAANKAASRNYQHQLKVRERKWMGDRSLYQTKLVQFDQEVDLANIAAQRAYTKTQISLNNAQALAILENQEDWKKMLSSEGTVEVSAAGRGIRGKSVGRQLVMNKGAFGMTQAMRTRGLVMAQYDAKEANEDVRRRLKAGLNQSFGKVALQPIPDVAPPRPVKQNALLAAILGGAQAGLSTYGSMDKPKTDYKNTTNTTQPSSPSLFNMDPVIDIGGYDPGAFNYGGLSQFNPSQTVGSYNFIPNSNPTISGSVNPFSGASFTGGL